MKPVLFIVGAPIGNMEDITLRAIDILGSVDTILSEDTRHTPKLPIRHGIRARMASRHNLNESARIGRVIGFLRGDESAALATNTGVPGILEPGSRIAAACSVTAALAVSGFGWERFLFEGCLPRQPPLQGKEDYRSWPRCPTPLLFLFRLTSAFDYYARWRSAWDPEPYSLPGKRLSSTNSSFLELPRRF